MDYLNKYGKNRKFQEGGMAPAPAEAAPAGGGGGGEMSGEELLGLAQATMQGDQQAAAQLGTLMAPMIMEQMQAQGGGGAPAAEAAPAGGEPVFKKGGEFLTKK